MIIGISGTAGSGKDLSADCLRHHFGFVKVAFADEIKRTAMRWFGFDPDQLWGPSERRNEPAPSLPDGPTAREVCQFLGTEVGRTLYEDIWINNVAETITRMALGTPPSSGFHYEYDSVRGLYAKDGWKPPPKGFVIPDVRFKNEIQALLRWNGVLIRLYRDTTLEGVAAAHASETEQRSVPDSEFDYIITNDKTPQDLEETLVKLVQDIYERNADTD